MIRRAFLMSMTLLILCCLSALLAPARHGLAETPATKLRLQALKYLLYGKMLRPPALALPEQEIEVSRLSIYAGQKDALQEYRKRCAPVLASAWQAPDGDIGIVLANVTDVPRPVSLVLSRELYPVPSHCTLFRIDSGGRREIGPVTGDAHLDFALPPEDACIYEFTKK